MAALLCRQNSCKPCSTLKKLTSTVSFLFSLATLTREIFACNLSKSLPTAQYLCLKCWDKWKQLCKCSCYCHIRDQQRCLPAWTAPLKGLPGAPSAQSVFPGTLSCSRPFSDEWLAIVETIVSCQGVFVRECKEEVFDGGRWYRRRKGVQVTGRYHALWTPLYALFLSSAYFDICFDAVECCLSFPSVLSLCWQQ